MKTLAVMALNVILLCALVVSSASAQGRGTITGTIRDAQTNELLPASTVHVQETGLGTSSGTDGRFIIRNVPAGSHTIRAVYVGYLSKEVPVIVPDGEDSKLDIRLSPVGIEGEEVLVTAQAAGQKAAINQQLSALPIVNVVSRDRIQELPDANAAESVSRLPGVSLIRTGGEGSKVVIRGLSPQYNRITIDGVEMPSNVASANDLIGTSDAGGGLAASGENLGDRGEDLSMISSSMLGGINVTKAITPDMDAAVLGGVVDFSLRKAVRSEPALDGQGKWAPMFEFKAQGGYTQLKNSYDNYRYTGSLEKRLFDQSFGIFVEASAEKRNLSSNVLEASYELIDKSHGTMALPRINTLNLSDVFRKRQRYGGTVVMDYQHEMGEVALMNFLSTSKTQEITRGESMSPFSGDATYGTALGYNVSEINNELDVISNLLSVKQDISFIHADVKLSHSYCESRNPEDFYTGFNQHYSTTDFDNHGDVSYVEPRVLASYVRHDAMNSFYWGYYTPSILSKERSMTGAVDLAADVAIASKISSRIKAGGMYQHRTRSYDLNVYVSAGEWDWEATRTEFLRAQYPWLIADGNGRLRMVPFTQDSYEYGEFLNGEYTLGYPIDISRLWAIARSIRPARLYDSRSQENVVNDYDGFENKSAGYVMATVNLGEEFDLVPGVRYQNLSTTYTGLQAVILPGSKFQGKEATYTHSHGYWLPMIHARYRPLDWMQFHFAYTNTVNYPDYSVLTPRYLISNGYIDYNNHALKPAISENLDLVISFQSNEIGLLAFTGFKKRIKDLVFFSHTYVSDLSKYPDLPQGGSQLYTFNTYINNPIPIDLWGIETEWQTHFWFLPKPFDGLVLNVNYTHIFSEASYPRSIVNTTYDDEGNMIRTVTDTSYTTRMLNQPNDIVNLAMGYDYRAFSLRLSLLYQDNIFKRPDFWIQQRIYSASYTRWDLSVKQGLPWLGLQVFFNISNITGENDLDVNAKNLFPANEQRYGMSADLGVQIRL